ncbi:MAG: acetylglutamate kinase [Gemmatimonadota bacterium]|nr:acetylglutamate kinase [Gemmatimonadota bacterium]
MPAAIAAAWRSSPGALCLVHGGGDEVTALQRQLGIEPTFVHGRRVTSDADVAIVRMALSGTINKRLVAQLTSQGVAAVGLSGEDAGLLEAELLDARRFGRVGVPARVNAALLQLLLDAGYLPVLSPLAREVSGAGAGNGAAVNVNGDDAAAAVAAALGATELLLVSDVPGVRVGPELLASLDVDEAAAMIASGAATGGMAAKLEAAMRALSSGVSRVRIGDLDMLAERARGTELTLSRSLV